MTEIVRVSNDGPIRTIQMNRPDKKNALTMPMYTAMAEAIETAGDSVHCFLITGSSGAFSAGNDLQDFRNAAQAGEGLADPVLRFLYALARSERPIVAAVEGLAVGIGTTMLLHCDYVVASSDARFSTPFVQLGLVPEAASSLLMPGLMGHRRAFSLLVMGRAMDAEAALAAGLVNAVVAAPEVLSEAIKAARDIAALPPEAVAASRRLMRGSPADIVSRIDEEAAVFKTRLQSPAARAAFEAFFQRRR
ncbi:MAG: crotonase/enoyl-CoA hydratase family protein [Bradyrhizobiaceae bacterium]|nr:crotonase/enoyl-CoA hydratase family protein [Bradyrhizobiaceae bacterium]